MLRGPVVWRRDWMTIASIVAAVTLYAVSVALFTDAYDIHIMLSFVIAALPSASVPIALRSARIAVIANTTGILAFVLLSLGSDGAPWPWSVPAIITSCAVIVTLGVRRKWAAALLAWGTTALVTVPFGVDVGSISNLITGVSITALALVVAGLAGQWRRVSDELFRERELSADEQQRRIRVEEQNRIAREMHDVVAHGLSLITVRATSAPYRLLDLPPEAVTELAAIAAASREATNEMRRLLGVLRTSATALETGPQPTLAELDALVDTIEAAGMVVTVERVGTLPLAGVASTTAYRIVQEALSNVVRHAPGASTHVQLSVSDGRLTVRVENDARAQVGPSGAPGHGLVGIRERAALLGGTSSCGVTDTGGFLVSATFPLDPPSGATA